MKQQLIYVYFISLFIGAPILTAQNVDSIEPVLDTLEVTKRYYSVRVGADLSKPLRSLLNDSYEGFELVGDFRLSERYFIAAELGNENRTIDLPNLNSTSKGSYIKAGFNYNAYNNWYGMNNQIYAGVRAGFSSFSQELNTYTIYTTNPLFGDDTREENIEFTGLNASWLELQLGVQVELIANIYIGINVQIKRSITQKEPNDFENLYIPGFGKTTDESSFGLGYGYTLSYLLPLTKKNRTVPPTLE